jgi:hypothetical protein
MLAKHGDPVHAAYARLVFNMERNFLALSFSDVFLTIPSESVQKVGSCSVL